MPLMSEASKSPIVIDESGSESPFSDTSSEPPIERVPLKQRLQELTDVEHMLAQSLAEASEALQALRPDVQANTRNSEEFAQHTKEYFRLLEVQLPITFSRL